MKAIVFSGTRGKPTEVLSVKEVPKPIPAKDQALIRVLLTPIHPSTLGGIQPGIYPGPGANEILSGEGVGVIEAYGEGTNATIPLKTRVLLLGSIGGTFAEYTLGSIHTLIPIPDSVSDHNAAQAIVNPLSALLLVKDVPPGQWLLQTGASSVLGKVVIQLSKHFGFKTINVVRNQDHVKDLLALGADAVITSTDEIHPKVTQLTEGKGVNFAIDPVGGSGTSVVIRSLASKGKLTIYGQLDKEDIHFPSGLLVVKLLTITGFWLTDWFKSAPLEERKSTLGELIKLLATGVINCPVEKEFGVHELEAALHSVTSSGKTGKVLLRFS